jgi:hypothetical protein
LFPLDQMAEVSSMHIITIKTFGINRVDHECTDVL